MNPNHSTPFPPRCPPAVPLQLLVDGGGKESSSPFLYLPKPGVARFQRMKWFLEEDAQENIPKLIFMMAAGERWRREAVVDK